MRLDVPVTGDGRRRLSPTDVSAYIQQGSCQRYLRLALLARGPGADPMRSYGVSEQALTPLLTNTGRTFEETVERTIRTLLPTRRLGQDGTTNREADNETLSRAARRLPAAGTIVLFQVRLRMPLGEWDLRGDADLVMLRRDAAGRLSVLVADIKSSTRPHLEHQLQVAFYARMIAAILEQDEVAVASLRLGVLYRAAEADRLAVDPEMAEQVAADRETARTEFGTGFACLSLVDDPIALQDTVDDLVAGPNSQAERIAVAPFADVPYHLADVCDGCRFNEFCMKWSAEHDDLTLIPFISGVEKSQLVRAGIRTTRQLAALKRVEQKVKGVPGPALRLVPEPVSLATVRRLGAWSGLGHRLDELILRAQAYRKGQGDDYPSVWDIPGGGSGTLPVVAADRHSNLVWVYIDAQKDYLNDRLYLLAARVVACDGGEPVREESIVEMSDGPPDDPLTERAIVGRWAQRLVSAVSRLAAPEPVTGARRAPVHLVFFSGQEMGDLLDGLSRHLREVFGASALYDFVTQPAAYDSPLVTELAGEIRERRNLPLIAQSLVRTSSFQGFDWNSPRPFRELFRARTFDFVRRLDGKGDEEGQWYTSRARFRSGIPLEYAYGIWGKLEIRPSGSRETVEPFLAPSRDEFLAFVDRRLDALVFVAGKLEPNRDAGKTPFDLPDLGAFESRAHDLGAALLEFLQIERHAEMAHWRRVRQLEPERRMVMGEAWVGSFHDEDQDPETRDALKAARERFDAHEEIARSGRKPSREESKALRWSLASRPLRFRLEVGLDAMDVDELLATSEMKPGEWAVLKERYAVDSRLPVEQRTPFTPTVKQLLYAPRVEIGTVTRESRDGHLDVRFEIEMQEARGGGGNGNGYTFAGHPAPPRDGATYTLDPNPDDFNGAGLQSTIQQIVDGRQNTLYDRLVAGSPTPADWPLDAAAGQDRFMAGLIALDEAGLLHDFEPGKHDFIARRSAEPFLLVQGPPGTGKSYTTAFAILARMQGALAAGRPFRVVAGCKTHAATDVLMLGILEARGKLRAWWASHPDLFARYFDERLLSVPILRSEPRSALPLGVHGVWRQGKQDEAGPDDRVGLKSLISDEHLILCALPGAIRVLDQPQAKNKRQLRPIHCLVLDEASQMNLPEALMAARLLDPAGQIIVVGDHRQMAPIIKHDWEGERRRTFQEYAVYRSLFDTLRLRQPEPAVIRFEESFRLHSSMAEFLRREIYRHDGIAYHSRRRDVLDVSRSIDGFIAAVLNPSYPMVIVLHDEAESQTRNQFEVRLLEPVLREMVDGLGLDPERGLGVVVPHRAQRAAFLNAIPELERETVDGQRRSSVETVEKFQGGEREAIVFAATESDPGYLATRAGFMFDPRRLTVAMSRAKRKMILVAGQTVFSHFSPDEETFANLLLWKNLLRRTCTVSLWHGTVEGHAVRVWGNETIPEVEASTGGIDPDEHGQLEQSR
jgi:hypothetical protein